MNEQKTKLMTKKLDSNLLL